MTNDKFKTLCEQVLVPCIGDLIHGQLGEVHEMLGLIARELARIEEVIEEIAAGNCNQR
jgi:hypothetical protein